MNLCESFHRETKRRINANAILLVQTYYNKIFHEKELNKNNLLRDLSVSCIENHLYLAKWIAHTFNAIRTKRDEIKFNFTFEYVCRNGYFTMAKWLPSFFTLNKSNVNYDIIKIMRSRNDINILKWFCKHFKITKNDFNYHFACQYASYDGKLNVLKFLVSNFNLTKDEIFVHNGYYRPFTAACGNGHIEVAKWMYYKFNIKKDDTQIYNSCIFRELIYSGHLKLARWFREVFQLTNEEIEIECLALSRYEEIIFHLPKIKKLLNIK